MIIALPIVICLIGLLMWVLSANPKLQEVGRIMFFCGLLATLLGAGPVLTSLTGRGN
jgi:hypothetical protein